MTEPVAEGKINTNSPEIWRDGLLNNNAGLVQLLGLCPLLAVTTTAVNGFGLGVATLLVLVLSNLAVSLLRHFLRREIRIPAYVLIIASLVTAIEMLMAAFLPALQEKLGIFVALIVTNCVIIARAESFARRHRPVPAIIDGLATGTGFLLALVAVGMLREAIGTLTLFGDTALLFEANPAIDVPQRTGLRLALLPPGAFLALALVIATTRRWQRSRTRSTQTRSETSP